MTEESVPEYMFLKVVQSRRFFTQILKMARCNARSVMIKCAAEDMCIQIRGSMDLCCLLALSLAYNKLGVNSNGRMLQFFLFTITVAFQGFSIPCVRPENFARPPEFLIKKNCCNFYISARPH